MTPASGGPAPASPGGPATPPAKGRLARRLGIVVGVLAILFLFYVAFAPYFMPRHGTSNDYAAINDLRTLVSAEAVYSASNGGYYDTLDCLVAPATCIPGHDPQAAPMLERSFLEPLKTGYLRRFHPGPRPTLEEVAKAKSSLSSLKTYAYVAVPLEPGKTGYRGFCVDDSGAIRLTQDGTPPPVKDGRCSESAELVQ